MPKEFNPKAFGDRILARMQTDGLSYRSLSVITGLDSAIIYRVANAKQEPKIETFLKIVRWLHSQHKTTNGDDG